MKWYMRFPNGVSKAVTLSFDDGVHEDIPISIRLKERGLHATFNLNSGLFTPDDIDTELYNKHSRLTSADCLKVFSNPLFEVAVHGKTHLCFTELSEEDAKLQINEDRNALERLFKTKVRGMAYPYGLFNEKTKETAIQCGIAYSRTVASHYDFAMPEDWLEWGPTCHYCENEVPNLINRFLELNPCEEPKLFYLWAHSYECTMHSNWSTLYEYLDKLAYKPDIWYATNIEVYDYTEAFNKLVFNYAEGMIYNPSAVTVWISDGKKILKVHEHETVSFG